MPLLWHGLAGRVCHNVGIASDIFVSHTFNIMRIKLSILIFVLSLSTLNAIGVEAEGKDARSNLISDIKNWVSSTLSIQQNEIKVLALDKRLKIPVCEESYTISFPYQKTNNTVLAECLKSEWRAYIGIKISQQVNAYAYTKSMLPGSVLTMQHLTKIEVNKNSKGLLNADDLKDTMVLNVKVSKQQLAEKRHLSKGVKVFTTTRDLKKGAEIGPNDFIAEIKSESQISKNQLLIAEVIEDSRASRDLQIDTTLSHSDLKLRKKVLVASEIIPKGQKVTPSNTKVSDYFDVIATDTLMSASDAEHMEVVRTIKSGSPIRLSDVRPSLMVKKGDDVFLVIERGSLSITTKMVALEDGKFGAQIKLKNPESQEIVSGIVSGPGKTKGI